MPGDFSATVGKWTKDAEIKQTAALHQSLRQLDKEIAANTPVVSGNLKNSRDLSSLGPPEINWKTKKFRDPSDSINNAAAGVEVGQTAWLGFRAPYAHLIEPKYAMLRLAAQRWRQIVDEAARMVRGGS